MSGLPSLAASLSDGIDSTLAPSGRSQSSPASADEAATASPPVPTSRAVVGAPPVDIDAVKELAVEVIPNLLYFTSLASHPTSTATHKFFTVTFSELYAPYFADFGPLNLAVLVRVCRALRTAVNDVAGTGTEIIFYAPHDPHARANAAYVVAGYCVLVLHRSLAEVEAMFASIYPPLLPFRDASYGLADFQLTISDITAGLIKARTLGWIDVDTFDADEYEHYDTVSNGDWNWIVPNKLIAFSSPVDGVAGRSAKAVIGPFRERGVQLIVRLNEKLYDRRQFTEVGMRHEDLIFPDGSTPSDTIVRQFLSMTERQAGVIAVHCKAGLGRTGTMLGIFMMKHYGFSAKEFIGWCRVARPGSVIGCQQLYLEKMQRRLDAAGEVYRRAQAKAPAAAPTAPGVSQGRPGTTAGASATGARPGTIGTLPPGSAATGTASSNRATSPPVRVNSARVAGPIKLVESLPYPVPRAARAAHTAAIQRVVDETLRPKAASGSASAAKATKAGGAQGGSRAPGVSQTGVVRPLLKPGATTFVAGLTKEMDPVMRATLQA